MTKQKKSAGHWQSLVHFSLKKKKYLRAKRVFFKVSFFFFLSHLQTQGTTTPPKGRGSATNSGLIHAVR
jgi:hypothetical protein